MKSKEIDLIPLAQKVAREWKLMLKFVLAFALVGVVYALEQQKTYTASVTLAPEISGMGMSSGLSDLAGIVGIKTGGSGSSTVDAIYPDIYPNVVYSSDFIVQLFSLPVTTSKDEKKTYYQHIIQDTKTPFWNLPKAALMRWIASLKKKKGKGNGQLDPKRLTEEQMSVCDAVRSSVNCQLDRHSNLINISVQDVDAEVAASLADTLQNRLQNYIYAYRTKKYVKDLEYVENLCTEARRNYEAARRTYAAYADAHSEVVLQSYQTRINDLENDMQLKYNIYTQTAEQVQDARVKVQEHTPVYSTLQQAVVPLEASSMARSKMVLIFMALGVAAHAFWVLLGRSMARRCLKRKEQEA